jgi:methylmalonyl-CoA/ethylmalonyl-CoA epimerase
MADWDTNMVRKIEHIGIVVADLEAALGKYTDLLELELAEIEEVEVEGVINRVAFLPLNGINVELVHTSGSEGLAADFLKKTGEGIHHIAFEVDNLEEKFQKLRARGVKFLWDKIIPGSRGTRVAFFEPKEFNGIYVELVEKH